MRVFVLLLLALLTVPRVGAAAASNLSRDEEMLLFPAFARKTAPGTASEAGTVWEAEVSGLVYEPEPRRWTLAALAGALDLGDVTLSSDEQAVLAERARLFMADNERGKRVMVRWRERVFDLGRSGPDGRFAGSIRIPASEAGPAGSLIRLQAVMPARDPRAFSGTVTLLDSDGWILISDIDDTIKHTGVADARSVLRKTLLEPFAPVTGMSGLYQRFQSRHGAAFFYVSASPWQLYPPLAGFLEDGGFPAGVWYLKRFRLKDRSFASLFADPVSYKTAILETLVEQFPGRRFVLVGDSGERDPEIYAALARKSPRQVAGIWIRDTTGEGPEVERYRRLVSDLAPGMLQVFTDPSGIGLPPEAGRSVP